jgi:hypothetical protein
MIIFCFFGRALGCWSPDRVDWPERWPMMGDCAEKPILRRRDNNRGNAFASLGRYENAIGSYAEGSASNRATRSVEQSRAMR